MMDYIDQNIPAFDDPWLESLAKAVSRWRKAIKKRARSLMCTREPGPENGERLNVDIETEEARPTQVRISVWTDGAFFLGVHQPGPRCRGGWTFAFKANGNIGSMAEGKAVSQLENTISIVHGAARAAGASEQLIELWREADLAVV